MDFKYGSLNVNGIGETQKRKDVFNFLRECKLDVYFLQETHLREHLEKYMRASWGYELWLAGNETNKNGVAILFRPTFEYKLHGIKKDPNGCYIMMDIELLNKRVTLVNVYGPSAGDNPDFFSKIHELIDEIGNEKNIVGGDFNCIQNMRIDSRNYTNLNNRPRTRKRIKEIMADNDLVDIYRELYPDKKAFTWRRFNTTKQGRLDYFLISTELISDVKGCAIKPGYRSDHSLVTLSLRKKEFARDRPFWKFNNSLLSDKEYIKIIKKTIHDTLIQYAVPVYNMENIKEMDPEDIELTISDQLFFETLLMEIRGRSISYASYKKKKTREEEERLNEILTQLEDKSDVTDTEVEEIEKIKQELERYRRHKIDGIAIRSRVQWLNSGEKATKYFLNLENRNFVNRSVSFIEKPNGEIVDKQEDILEEVHNFYKNLYSKKEVNNITLEELIPERPTLDLNDNMTLQGKITYLEAACALKNMKNEKSPGPDGFTAEFFKFFFVDIGKYFIRSINEGLEKGELSVTQYQGVITCLPKEGKPKQFIKNWRPISLLNVTYKILSSCIALRIRNVLPKIIHESQKGFMKNRYIGENIRLLYDVLLSCETRQIPGLLLMVDFEKAFDSVSWDFIRKALRYFEFCPYIINFFETIYHRPSSCITFNGQYTKWFNPERGCRQGDPISPYLYLICAEVMSLMFRKNNRIKGIKIKENETLLSLFADDTTLYLDGSEESFKAAIETLDSFSKLSGLKMNNEKTQIVWIGSKRNCGDIFMRDRNFIWDPGTFKVLGVLFSTETKTITEINFNGKIDEAKRLMAKWKKRVLTPLGKITILKTLIVPKLTYLLINLPDPTDQFLKEYDKLLFQFLWGGKTNRIKRETVCQPYENGGLKMIDIYSSMVTFKISWLRRIFLTEGGKSILKIYPELEHLQTFGIDYATKTLRETSNLFWKDVIKHYITLSKKFNMLNDTPYSEQPIHFNPLLKRDNKSIYMKEWVENGICKIKDILTEDDVLLDFRKFKEIYPGTINTNFLTYQGIVRSILKFKRSITVNGKGEGKKNQDHVWTFILNNNKEVKSLLLTSKTPPTAVLKWNLSYDNLNWRRIFGKCFKVSKDTQLQWFQVRTLHRILPTNRYLKMCKIVESHDCTFCNTDIETVEHLLWECNYVQLFWKELLKLLREKCTHCDRFAFSKELVIFGLKENVMLDNAIDFIILFAKFFIYKCKLEKVIPLNKNFIKCLITRLKIERHNASAQKKFNVFKANWLPYNLLLEQPF